jgi:membrane protein YqaA with SNARE-associated domain
MFRKLYDKCLELAGHRLAKLWLGILSFTESSFFPIPPDVMIAPMVLANKKDYFKIFLIATIWSTLGGLLGYFLGYIFIDLAMSIINFYGYEEKFVEIKNNINNNQGSLLWLISLFLAGFTPIPFKVFTITSGFLSFNIYLFFLVCLISRGLRFFVVSYLTFKFSESFVKFFEAKGGFYSMLIGLILVTLFALVYIFFK